MWALGVIVYEMVALRLPFAAENLVALALAITSGQFEPLSSAVGLNQVGRHPGEPSAKRACTVWQGVLSDASCTRRGPELGRAPIT